MRFLRFLFNGCIIAIIIVICVSWQVRTYRVPAPAPRPAPSAWGSKPALQVPCKVKQAALTSGPPDRSRIKVPNSDSHGIPYLVMLHPDPGPEVTATPQEKRAYAMCQEAGLLVYLVLVYRDRCPAPIETLPWSEPGDTLPGDKVLLDSRAELAVDQLHGADQRRWFLLLGGRVLWQGPADPAALDAALARLEAEGPPPRSKPEKKPVRKSR